MENPVFSAFRNYLVELQDKEIENLKNEIKSQKTWYIKNARVISNYDDDDTEQYSWDRVAFDVCYGDLVIIEFAFRPMTRVFVNELDPVDYDELYAHPNTKPVKNGFSIMEAWQGLVRDWMYWIEILQTTEDEFFVTSGAKKKCYAQLPRVAVVLIFEFFKEVVDNYYAFDQEIHAETRKKLDMVLESMGIQEIVREKIL